MRGRCTGIVLGAGASACYSGSPAGVPTQRDMVGRLFFGADTSSGEGFPSFGGTSGLKHSFQLGQYLRERFGLKERPEIEGAKLDFWTHLQARSFNLESLYEELDHDSSFPRSLLEDFEAILRTAVAEPSGDREIAKVCEHHACLVDALEPGDYIINFNWDTVMADALLHRSHLWFPTTGFGVPATGALIGKRSQKSFNLRSHITLLQVHGSVCLFEPLAEAASPSPVMLYIGPGGWSPITGLAQLAGMDLSDAEPGREAVRKREPTPEEVRRITRGWIFFRGTWFRPLFVPPSKRKQASHWYEREMRRLVHTLLPQTEQLVVAGYSFPKTDQAHLRRLFVPDILPDELNVMIVNHSNGEAEFTDAVQRVFPSVGAIDWQFRDFKEFCGALSRPQKRGEQLRLSTSSD